MRRDVLDNGRWRLHTPGHLYHHIGVCLPCSSPDRPRPRRVPWRRRKLFIFCSCCLFFSISLVKLNYTHACVEVFYPFSFKRADSILGFLFGCPSFRVVGSRESQRCGTRRCLSLLRQPLFPPSALRLRRARRREISCSSLRKFTRTRTWVSTCVKRPFYFYGESLLPLTFSSR